MIHYSEIFYNFAVGIGVLLAGFGGLKILSDWLKNVREKKRKEKLTTELKSRYPQSDHGETFQLIESKAKPGKIYLLDKVTNKKRHIASPSTFQALEFERHMVKELDHKEFKSIKTGKRILIE
jgi:hypothetical protein